MGQPEFFDLSRRYEGLDAKQGITVTVYLTPNLFRITLNRTV